MTSEVPARFLYTMGANLIEQSYDPLKHHNAGRCHLPCPVLAATRNRGAKCAVRSRYGQSAADAWLRGRFKRDVDLYDLP